MWAGPGIWSNRRYADEVTTWLHPTCHVMTPAATLRDYAETVVRAIGDRRNVVVVGHSYGGFTAPVVAERCSADALVFVAAMVPVIGEHPTDWWKNTLISYRLVRR